MMHPQTNSQKISPLVFDYSSVAPSHQPLVLAF